MRHTLSHQLAAWQQVGRAIKHQETHGFNDRRLWLFVCGVCILTLFMSICTLFCLVVYLPLWNMMDFVSDDFPVPTEWKFRKFHGSKLQTTKQFLWTTPSANMKNTNKNHLRRKVGSWMASPWMVKKNPPFHPLNHHVKKYVHLNFPIFFPTSHSFPPFPHISYLPYMFPIFSTSALLPH